MYRLTASILIALVVFSGALAHAGGHGDSMKTHQASLHGHGMMDMEAADMDMDGHESHLASCALGHCAVFCGVIIPSFSVSVLLSSVDAQHERSKIYLASADTSADPPPPKS